MECPRCGGTVTIYQLGDRESYVCGDCEYVGIDVEHGADPEEVESWDEAMERFYERFVGDGDDGVIEETAIDGDTGDGVTDSDTGDGEADSDEAPAGETGDDEVEADAGGDDEVEADAGGDDDEVEADAGGDDDEGAVEAGGTGDDGADGELTPAIVRVDADVGGS